MTVLTSLDCILKERSTGKQKSWVLALMSMTDRALAKYWSSLGLFHRLWNEQLNKVISGIHSNCKIPRLCFCSWHIFCLIAILISFQDGTCKPGVYILSIMSEWLPPRALWGLFLPIQRSLSALRQAFSCSARAYDICEWFYKGGSPHTLEEKINVSLFHCSLTVSHSLTVTLPEEPSLWFVKCLCDQAGPGGSPGQYRLFTTSVHFKLCNILFTSACFLKYRSRIPTQFQMKVQVTMMSCGTCDLLDFSARMSHLPALENRAPTHTHESIYPRTGMHCLVPLAAHTQTHAWFLILDSALWLGALIFPSCHLHFHSGNFGF